MWHNHSLPLCALGDPSHLPAPAALRPVCIFAPGLMSLAEQLPMLRILRRVLYDLRCHPASDGRQSLETCFVQSDPFSSALAATPPWPLSPSTSTTFRLATALAATNSYAWRRTRTMQSVTLTRNPAAKPLPLLLSCPVVQPSSAREHGATARSRRSSVPRPVSPKRPPTPSAARLRGEKGHFLRTGRKLGRPASNYLR